LIRDRGPISSLGHGVTSRDTPINEGESEGPSPNSGAIGRALNGHPVMRFFASTAAAVTSAAVLGGMMKGGGLKIAKSIQKSATEGGEYSTRFVESATKLRRALDELQGLQRYVDDTVDPYSALVHEVDGKLTTGQTWSIANVDQILENGTYITRKEIQDAGKGVTKEPAAVWSFRDDLQQKLVQQARRLPYELPALYISQRAITDPLFGENQDRRKIKWYNPVDVLADFAKQSVMNIGMITAPTAVGGAALSRAKFYINAPYASNPNLSLTAKQMKVADRFADAKVVLEEVGHDLGKLTNKASRFASSTAGAFNMAVEEAAKQQGSPVFAMHQARAGSKALGESLQKQNVGKNKITLQKAKAFFLGAKVGDENYQGFIDTLPTMRGFTHGFRTFGEKFQVVKQGYDVVSGAKSFDEVVNAAKHGPRKTSAEELATAIRVVQGQHSSKFSAFAESVGKVMGKSGPSNTRFGTKDFTQIVQENEYKKQLKRYLIHNNADEKAAEEFSRKIHVSETPRSLQNAPHVSQRISIGRSRIQESTDDDFYEQISKRFRKQFGFEGAPSADVIRKSIEQTDNYVTSKEFQASLKAKVSSLSDTFYNQSALPYGAGLLKPQKAVYQEFVGPLTAAKEDFLRRRTAQVLGINLVDANGRAVGSKMVNNELMKRGFDVDNFGQLRGFLVNNKAMTSQASSGGYNLFGMKQLLVDEAFDKGIFNHMSPEQRDIVRDLAGKLKLNDPVSKSIGFSKLDGVYQNKHGEVVDLTRIKSMVTGLGNFFANEFQIPIVKFNPLQMLGVGGPTGVSKSSPFQIVHGKSVQPFGGLESHAADIFVWTKTGGGMFGPKGTLSSISTNEYGEGTISKLSGTFRPINTRESNIFSRAATYAANRGAALRTAELEAAEAGRDLTFLERFKKSFDIDEEQPNSLFRLFERFRKRQSDINNPQVFGRLLSEDTITVGSKRSGKTLTLQTGADGRSSVVNQAGEEVYDNKSILRAYDTFRRATEEYGTPLRIIKEVEEKLGLSANIGGRTVTPSSATGSELNQLAKTLKDMLPEDRALLRSQGTETRGLSASFSRVERYIDESDLGALSSMAAKSPSVSTRMDEFRNEIYRYMLERHAYVNAKGDPGALLRIVDESINDLKKRGLISAGQVAEARAAGLSTFFNINAFKTYNRKQISGLGTAEAMSSARSIAKQNSQSFRNMASPFVDGTSSIIDTSGLKKTTSLIRPAFKKKFGTADYQMDELASNPLGDASTVFAPTFKTVVDRVGLRRALMSAAGLSTYKDPEAFSFTSIPISHGFERLNRYFGSLGLGLDPNKYAGPVPMYAKGMVGKRVLPIVAAGTGVMTVDRTIGGVVNEEDQRGEKVYSPFFLGKAATGVMELQAGISGIVPGGMGYQEKKEQLTEGEVPIRQGRFWPLGTTPFQGGKVMYHRPSWYRRLQGGAMYTSDSFGSPVEKFLYGYDFSPLRPLDPYRYEREHYEDRPYPVTGEYFTGPFGPVTDFLNMTVGKVLKPQLRMHEAEVNAALSQYVPAGQSGAFNPAGLVMSGRVQVTGGAGPGGYSPATVIGPGGSQMGISSYNQEMASRAGSLGTGRNIVSTTLGTQNASYVQASQFGPPPVPGTVPPQIVAAGTPISGANINLQAGQLGYKLQETAGIYGFGFGSLREGLGFGSQDFEPQRSVLQSAAKGYGTTRAFWDLNLGGLGDVPLTAEGALGNIEISEIVRRFIPKERTNVNYLNPIRNTMATQYPFLPGADYFINFQQGDPFTKVQEGELRLPGVGYERFNPRAAGYDQLTQLDILADVAPYSKQFRELNRQMSAGSLEGADRVRLEEIRQQVEQTTKKYDFAEYKYKYSTPEELGTDFKGYTLGRMGEYIAHRDTYFNTKFLQKRTAQEDWERRNVYGATFPEWQRPFESFVKPMLYKATQRDPLVAGIGLSVVGSMFGKSGRAKAFGAIAGFAAGTAYSTYGNVKEMVTGERFIPEARKEQLALEEYSDILTYVKNTSLSQKAAASGDMAAAAQFGQAAKRTMYGADIYGASVDTLSLAIPKRKREHFKAMINAPEEERERILSTSGRLERRIYQAAWGMGVEEKPDLVEYFSRHELPGLSWEGWHPNTNMEHVKIKMGQSMGIEMSQMGYYPQQVREANLTNPSYPQFEAQEEEQNVAAQLRALMSRNGINGSVTPVMTPFGGSSAQISGGLIRDLVF
jgi:hypothetical protein